MKPFFTSPGIQVYQPSRFIKIVPMDIPEPSKWEKRRSALRWKLKRKIAVRNRFIVYPIMIIAFLAGMLIVGCIGYFLKTALLGFPLGIVMFYVLLVVYEGLTGMLPVDANDVRLKR